MSSRQMLATDGAAAPRRRGVQALVALGVTLVIVLALGVRGEAGGEFPLDDYPGFGRSADAAMRDDTIAYWEAYERELLVRSCMADAGFSYQPVVEFPGDTTVHVADNLGVAEERSVTPAMSPRDRNRAYEAGLSHAGRDRWYRTLLGERAADIDEANRDGRIPAHRGPDFATGGCFGDAQAAIPGIWQQPRRLEPEFERMRQEIAADPAIERAKQEYATCSERAGGIRLLGPGALDEFVAEAEAAGQKIDYAELELIDARCMPAWVAGYRQAEIRAAERFAERNSALLDGQAQRYADVLEEIASDEAFRAYIADHAALEADPGR